MTSTNAPAAMAPAITLEPVIQPPRCISLTDEQIRGLEAQHLLALRDETATFLETVLRKKELIDTGLEAYRVQVLQKIEMEEAQAKRLQEEAANHARQAAAGREWLAKIG